MDGVEDLATIIERIRHPVRTPEREQAADLATEQAFLDALFYYPIDNRRTGECWRDTFTRGETGKPNPPRSPDAPYARGSRQRVIDATLDMLAAHYPAQLERYGVLKAVGELGARLDQMDRHRIEGLAGHAAGGTRKARDWNLG